jgi:hypothetical protein
VTAAAAAEPPRLYFLRGGLVALIWIVGMLPAALGIQRCTFAAIFHHPCPGCGLTRATHLLLEGHVVDSLHMHPFVVPLLAAHAFLALATVRSTVLEGAPWTFFRDRFGRAAVYFLGGVYVAMTVMWILRAFGLFGGPVPI